MRVVILPVLRSFPVWVAVSYITMIVVVVMSFALLVQIFRVATGNVPYTKPVRRSPPISCRNVVWVVISGGRGRGVRNATISVAYCDTRTRGDLSFAAPVVWTHSTDNSLQWPRSDDFPLLVLLLPV